MPICMCGDRRQLRRLGFLLHLSVPQKRIQVACLEMQGSLYAGHLVFPQHILVSS